MAAQTVRDVLLSRRFHVALLVVGALFLSINAFHNLVWFDESYSVAIATHSFAEIWDIGSGDVHPVLFYWCLHILYLIFGQNLVVYRLFTVAGCVALAALGLTHIRKDFDERVGLIFSFLALFFPYVIQMSVEIRMYSWVTFTVMLCALYGYRIVAALSKTVPAKIAQSTKGKKTWANAPRSWWIVFCLSSLASAYLQYYGTMSAFFINLLVLLFLIATVKRNYRAIVVFAVSAVFQVALFLPWLYVAVLSQIGVVSGSYWAKFQFPETLLELTLYPVRTNCIVAGLHGDYGSAVHWIISIDRAAAVVLAAIIVVASLRSGWKKHQERKANGGEAHLGVIGRFFAWSRKDTVAPYLGAFAIYLSVFLFALVVGILINSVILYYRYLYVAFGPLLFAIAGLLSNAKPRWAAHGLLVAVMYVSCVQMVLFTADCYDERNVEPIEELQEMSSESNLMVSSDIGVMGVTAIACPDIKQIYMDWQHGNWDKAYRAYDFCLHSEYSWESILSDYHGEFILLAQSPSNQKARSFEDLTDRDDIELIEVKTYFRPYERTWFTIALMKKL